MDSYDCNAGCGGCSRSCGGAYNVSSNDIYSQQNSYSVGGDDEEEQKYRAFGGN